tara:strand:- start:6516 stop:7502 length:987 start_codon:yes stop_codon:yes gene_type:complete
MQNININNTVERYFNYGHCNGNPLFDDNEIEYLRSAIEKHHPKKIHQISLFNIEDEQALKLIFKAYNSEFIKSILKEIEKYTNTPISILPGFDVMRNQHLNKFYSKDDGWHRDCGGELIHDYCKKKLYQKSYIFGKIGIYLQENQEYGGSVDLIPFSHKYFNPKTIFIRKLKAIPMRMIYLLNSKVPSVHKIFPDKFYMFLMRAKKMYPKIGSPLFFDSRIIHRSSPIDRSVLNKVKFVPDAKNVAETPKEKIKYAIYCHFGSTLATDSYMYDRLRRDGENIPGYSSMSMELKRWCDEADKVEKFSPLLAHSIKDVINPILTKYQDYI